MRVATAEGPDGLFLYYMAFSIHTVKQYFESVAKKNQPIYIMIMLFLFNKYCITFDLIFNLTSANISLKVVNNLSSIDLVVLDITLLYKVPSNSTGKNFVTNLYCFYL